MYFSRRPFSGSVAEVKFGEVVTHLGDLNLGGLCFQSFHMSLGMDTQPGVTIGAELQPDMLVENVM